MHSWGGGSMLLSRSMVLPPHVSTEREPVAWDQLCPAQRSTSGCGGVSPGQWDCPRVGGSKLSGFHTSEPVTCSSLSETSRIR